MNWSIKLGRIFGIDIKMHLTFLLILGWGAFAYGGSAGPLYGLIVTLGLFSLVLLHELGHSLAALGYGIPVRDITLLPIGGVARLERMPEKPLHELVVALAGPAVNVILAVILLPIVMVLNGGRANLFSLGLATEPGLLSWLGFLLMANVSLALFNMIPAFPLDGGRVFRAFLGFFTDYHRATQIAATVGRILAIGLGLFALYYGQVWVAMIAFFIFIVGGQEAQAVAARSVLRRALAGQALAQNTISLSPEATVGQVAAIPSGVRRPDFAVLDPGSGRLLGVATGHNITRAIERGQWYRRVTEIMQLAPNVPKVSFNTPLDEVQDKLVETSSRVAAVYDGLHFRGLITLDDIYRVFRFLSRHGSTTPRMRLDTAG
jgi:Zn-dependent protease/CBS domain-containing protein